MSVLKLPNNPTIDLNRVKSTSKEVLLGNDLVPVVDYDGVDMVFLGRNEDGSANYKSIAALQFAGEITNYYDYDGILANTKEIVSEALDGIPVEERTGIQYGPAAIANQMGEGNTSIRWD